MPTDITIHSELTTEEVQKALQAAFPDKEIIIGAYSESTKPKLENECKCDNDDKNQVSNKIELVEDEAKQLRKAWVIKEKERLEMEKSSSKALASVQTFHHQQKQLFDEFVLLRQRYDEQRVNLLDALWQRCCKTHPALTHMPDQENEETFLENDDQVGQYNLGGVLGEGQFAMVKSCLISQSRAKKELVPGEQSREYAMKIINKDRILSFHSLRRVSNEVDILLKLRNDYVVAIYDAIQTKSKLYLVTEKGGEDLFEFFDEHPDGVPESWARKIMKRILKGVLYCHASGVCHRDLKPENILVSFDTEASECTSLKLCDFGLAIEFEEHEAFSDFCGSPGFFAPEMITKGLYFGDKVDVWSCGCILLELILGHERFCETWMVSYDYEVLQEKAHFSSEIEATVENLTQVLDFSDELNDFVMQFLEIRSSRRPSASDILNHPWLMVDNEDRHEINALLRDAEEVKAKRPGRLSRANSESVGNLNIETKEGRVNSDLSIITDVDGTTGEEECPNSSIKSSTAPSQIRDRSLSTLSNSSPPTGEVDPELLKSAFHNFSDKERKMYEHYNADPKHHLNLPPIEPQTPNVGMARKILLRGADLANKIQHGAPSPVGSSGTSTPVRSKLVHSQSAKNIASGDTQVDITVSTPNSVMGSDFGSPTGITPTRGGLSVDTGSPVMVIGGPPLASPSIGNKLPRVIEDELDKSVS